MKYTISPHFPFRSFSVNFSAIHKINDIIDNVFCQQPCFSGLSDDISFRVSDHYPIMFTLYHFTETTISNPLTSRHGFNSQDEFVKFEESWASITFVDYPSTATVNQFYEPLLSSKSSLLKRKPRRGCNFFSTTHRIHFFQRAKKTLYKASVVKIPLKRILNNWKQQDQLLRTQLS